MQKIKAEIHLKSIQDNAKAFAKLCKVKVCAVVKADAYGHGAQEVACALSGVVDCFAVALIEEGLALQAAATGKEILVLTPPTDEAQAFAIVSGGLTGSVTGISDAKLFLKVCKKFRLQAKVHLKVNTGMNRYGMTLSELEKVCRMLFARKEVEVTGVYSHLYSPESAEGQRALFLQASALCRQYYPTATRHLSATYGCLKGEDFAFDMVRVGIGLYGYLPDGLTDTERKKAEGLRLKKGMTAYALAVGSHTYDFGGAGYGKPCVDLRKGEKLTLLRAGYADGLLRKADNGVLGAERNANNLCMDICIRKGEEKKGSWVLLFSDAEEVAKKTERIAYEVLCAVGARAEYIYLYD